MTCRRALVAVKRPRYVHTSCRRSVKRSDHRWPPPLAGPSALLRLCGLPIVPTAASLTRNRKRAAQGAEGGLCTGRATWLSPLACKLRGLLHNSPPFL